MIYSAFCGTGKSYLCTGKSYLCDKYSFTELECWRYSLNNFPYNYIEDIKLNMNSDYLFISTNPIVLKELTRQSIDIVLIYPHISLKEEYMIRYRNRGSSDDFIKMIDKNWEKWITELDEINFCKKIVLESNEYIKNKINFK